MKKNKVEDSANKKYDEGELYPHHSCKHSSDKFEALYKQYVIKVIQRQQNLSDELFQKVFSRLNNL
ncbi:hypothetical protein [Spirosoma validum]|uniref:Uncharacterized protein n=1 Tax=Spirosoma validum TaxID=2771355 RepID=A0A927GEX6_9BACT|nr:hypothetical protein [Spirosoma validum]MBD2755259.1 hypothetical protein [Spirosoma validum]